MQFRFRSRATIVVALIILGILSARTFTRPWGTDATAAVVHVASLLRTRATAVWCALVDVECVTARDARIQSLERALVDVERAVIIARGMSSPHPSLRGAYQSVPAEVIAGSLGPLAYTVTVSAGSSDGVVAGAPVLADGALVGIVDRVGMRRSVVALLADRSTRLDVELSDAPGPIGVLEASPGGGVVVARIPNDRDIPDGAHIVTGIARNEIPRGIPVGRLRDLRDSVDGFSRIGALDAAMDVRSTTTVTILVSRTLDDAP